MDGEFHFEAVWVFILLPLPLLIYRFLPRAQSSAVALRVPFYRSLDTLDQSQAGVTTPRLWLLLIFWVLLTIAAARPQWIGDNASVPLSGRDLMLAVDISGSMKARDMYVNGIPENRLLAVKQVAGDFIERRRGDRIGSVSYTHLTLPTNREV